MASQINIVALIKPKAGKIDRVEELFATAAAHVKANEPGTLKYDLQREQTKGDAPMLVVLEEYKDKKSIAIHGGSGPFKDFGRALKKEDLLREPITVIMTKGVGGFASRL